MGFAERAGGGLAGLRVDVGDHHLGAFRHITPGDRKTDSVRSAGHHRDLILKLHGALRVPTVLQRMFRRSGYRFAAKNMRHLKNLEHVPNPPEWDML